jgi:hypothetical protein
MNLLIFFINKKYTKEKYVNKNFQNAENSIEISECTNIERFWSY